MNDSAENLAAGTHVWLTTFPYGEPGVVQRIVRGKADVYWADLGFTGRHSLTSLMLARSQATHATN